MGPTFPPTAHHAGQGPIPLSTLLSDRAGDDTIAENQMPMPSAPSLLEGAIRTLDTAVGGTPQDPSKPRWGTRPNQIVDSAAEIFAEYGYYGASLRDIAHHVGISHPGMLHHFHSKNALLDAVIDRLETHAQQGLDHIEEISANTNSLLQALSERWNPTTHSIQLLATLDAEAVSKDHPGRFRMARLRRVHEHVLGQCLTSFADRGQLREGIEPAFAARAIVALVLGHAVREKTVRTMQNATHDDSPIKDLSTLTRIFLAD